MFVSGPPWSEESVAIFMNNTLGGRRGRRVDTGPGRGEETEPEQGRPCLGVTVVEDCGWKGSVGGVSPALTGSGGLSVSWRGN